eukprot:CAMPEP_0115872718 /NCGR_PEP_ID=MMETSP0287-20121206/23581_1 /TAXON_ID=412157 /ORGANISM="Chrysochromulina rotalis, Strain UIO044" /LENGTH=244 /DNA_ID=CAMNT_0003327669 /DNA_START=51 /DNA_END=785 /DNA_ORIENTATION=-
MPPRKCVGPCDAPGCIRTDNNCRFRPASKPELDGKCVCPNARCQFWGGNRDEEREKAARAAKAATKAALAQARAAAALSDLYCDADPGDQTPFDQLRSCVDSLEWCMDELKGVTGNQPQCLADPRRSIHTIIRRMRQRKADADAIIESCISEALEAAAAAAATAPAAGAGSSLGARVMDAECALVGMGMVGAPPSTTEAEASASERMRRKRPATAADGGGCTTGRLRLVEATVAIFDDATPDDC